MLWALFVVVVVAAAVAYAFRLPQAGSPIMWLGIGLPYLALALIGLVRLHRKRRLGTLLRFRPGDPSLGILLGLALLGGAWLFAQLVLPSGSSERAWLLRVFLIAGDSSGVGMVALLLGIVLCEEIVWRGWVQSELRDTLGPRRAWAAGAVLYAAAHLPTLLTLQDPAAGKNPLLVLAALGCGLCWGFLAERSGRLVPGLFAHAVFSYLATRSFWLFV
jgi:membrane protease YdiL (CAAX protease family)